MVVGNLPGYIWCGKGGGGGIWVGIQIWDLEKDVWVEKIDFTAKPN
jgi:hypothetical protein